MKGMRGVARLGRGGALVVLALGAWPDGPLAAQGPEPALDRIEEWVGEGRLEESRRELEEWWDDRSTAVSRGEFQRALWFRALLTREAEAAEFDYRRLVTEFPGGPYSDRALLRLGHAAHARGDVASADAHFGRLLQDHPTSLHRGEAERLRGRSVPGPLVASTGPSAGSASATGAAGPPAGAENPAPAGGSTGTPSDRPPAGPPATARGPWAVQLGAFSAAAGARTVADRARAAGFEPRLVRTAGSDLVRVRLGGYPEESVARELLDRVRTRGFDAAVVSDADRESPAG